MEIINRKIIHAENNKTTHLIELENCSEHTYSDRYQVHAAINNNGTYEIKEIYCYNRENQQYHYVTNLISPEIFNDII